MLPPSIVKNIVEALVAPTLVQRVPGNQGTPGMNVTPAASPYYRNQSGEMLTSPLGAVYIRPQP